MFFFQTARKLHEVMIVTTFRLEYEFSVLMRRIRIGDRQLLFFVYCSASYGKFILVDVLVLESKGWSSAKT